MKNKCYNCERRHVGCHVTCEDYKKFKVSQDAIRKESEKAKLKDVLIAERVREKARLQALRKKKRGK